MIKTLTIITFMFLGEHPPYYRWMTCEQRMVEFNKKPDICTKIDYAQKSLKDQCFMDFYKELLNKTNEGYNFYMGLGGVYYSNDSIRNADFTAWKKGCGCPSQ